jgi:hypothetical protein
VPRIPTNATTTRERLEEAAREIGVLLMAFAPLDVALTDRPSTRWTPLLLFFVTGVLFLGGALASERRRQRAAR